MTLQTGVSPLQESELSELKETIEILKTKNTEAQEIIQGALSHPDMAPQGGPPSALPLCTAQRVSVFHYSFTTLFYYFVITKQQWVWITSSEFDLCF